MSRNDFSDHILENEFGGFVNLSRQPKAALALTFTVCLLLFFQNCSSIKNPLQFSKTSNNASETDGTGAHPYDGKIYSLFGEVCSDSTTLQSRIRIASGGKAELIRQDCQSIAPVLLSPTDYMISASGADLTYKRKTFVLTQPDAVGAGFGVLPKLNSPVDPTSFGAIGDGVTDNTQAFLAALNAGDILIPDGNYVIKGTIRVPAGRNIQCKSLSTVTLINPNTAALDIQTFQFWSSGGSISNCHLTGSNVLNPNGSAVFDVNYQFNFLVSIVDYWGPVSNITVSNNLFENCHGNACVAVYSSTGSGAANSNIVNNTFKNCGYHSVAIDGGNQIVYSSNYSTDCSVSVQVTAAATGSKYQNTLEYNFLASNHGNGILQSGGALYLTGGIDNADYSSSLVRYNTVAGNGTPYSFQIMMQAAMPAQYLDNTCTNGCFLH